MRRRSLSHLTVLEFGPPDLITLVADAGFSSVGIRLSSPMPGGIAYPPQAGGEIAETSLFPLTYTRVRGGRAWPSRTDLVKL